MKLFDRLRKALTPACGHTTLITEMTVALAKITIERDDALKGNAELHNRLQGELSMRQLGDRRIRELQTQLEREQDAHGTTRVLLTAAIDRADDTTSALEETTSRIALLEQQLRDPRGPVIDFVRDLYTTLNDFPPAEGTDAMYRAIQRLQAWAEGGNDDEQTAMPFELAEAGGEAPIAEDELISDSTMTAVYRLVGIFFDTGRHHWLLASGENTITAPIHDPEFREQLKRREVSFAPGDALKADFRVLSFRKPDGDVYAKYSVEKVHQIIAPDEQLPLAEVTRG